MTPKDFLSIVYGRVYCSVKIPVSHCQIFSCTVYKTTLFRKTTNCKNVSE